MTVKELADMLNRYIKDVPEAGDDPVLVASATGILTVEGADMGVVHDVPSLIIETEGLT